NGSKFASHVSNRGCCGWSSTQPRSVTETDQQSAESSYLALFLPLSHIIYNNQLLALFRRRSSEGSLHDIVRVARARIIPPKPPHHFREHCPALFLCMQPNTPRGIGTKTNTNARLNRRGFLRETILGGLGLAVPL